MKFISTSTIIICLFISCLQKAGACTNFMAGKNATVDGSTIITYAADSHTLYGELYHWPAQDWPQGSMLE
ncbi:MAG: C69 family dipeptidase, partial [Bacteroidota bacterium]|nr:C69 family dipeptidase [Bacteroidota bacterium]